MSDKIVNPLSGRLITLHGALHRRLIRQGVVDPAGRSLIDVDAAPQVPKRKQAKQPVGPAKDARDVVSGVSKRAKTVVEREEGLGDLSELDKLLGKYIDRETGVIDHAGYNAQFEIYDERIDPAGSDRRARERKSPQGQWSPQGRRETASQARSASNKKAVKTPDPEDYGAEDYDAYGAEDYDPREGNPYWDGQPDDESDDEINL